MPAVLVLALLAEAVFHHVGLEADDGLDPYLAALLVELDDAREDAVVGDGQGGHAHLRRAGYQVVHLAGPVQCRKMGVDVQVAEAGRRCRRLVLRLLRRLLRRPLERLFRRFGAGRRR